MLPMIKMPKKVSAHQKKSFDGKAVFPGEIGNPFDHILRKLNSINAISPLLFFIALIFLSGIGTFFHLLNWAILLIFFLIDWVLIYNLKNLKISFGSSQSQVILLSVLRIPFIWLLTPYNIILQIIGILLVIYGFYIEPSNINCSYVKIKKNPLKNNNKIRIIQIGDIHLERFGIREQKLIELLTEKKPDLIVFTGDFLNLSNNTDPIAIDQIINLLLSIQNIAPTYCVTGSPAVDLMDTLKIIENKANVQFLNDIHCKIKVNDQSINIIGISCSHNPMKDILKLDQIPTKPDEFNLLLYHSPDLLLEIKEEHNIDLMMSGHTHGGQVRLPFFGAIFTGSLYGRIFQAGLYNYLSTTLYISRGIGFEGMGAPRVRFLCKPEITEWTI